MKSTYDTVILTRDSEHHIFVASKYDALKRMFLEHRGVHGSTFTLKIPNLYLVVATVTKRPYVLTNRRPL